MKCTLPHFAKGLRHNLSQIWNRSHHLWYPGSLPLLLRTAQCPGHLYNKRHVAAVQYKIASLKFWIWGLLVWFYFP